MRPMLIAGWACPLILAARPGGMAGVSARVGLWGRSPVLANPWATRENGPGTMLAGTKPCLTVPNIGDTVLPT